MNQLISAGSGGEWRQEKAIRVIRCLFPRSGAAHAWLDYALRGIGALVEPFVNDRMAIRKCHPARPTVVAGRIVNKIGIPRRCHRRHGERGIVDGEGVLVQNHPGIGRARRGE